METGESLPATSQFISNLLHSLTLLGKNDFAP